MLGKKEKEFKGLQSSKQLQSEILKFPAGLKYEIVIL